MTEQKKNNRNPSGQRGKPRNSGKSKPRQKPRKSKDPRWNRNRDHQRRTNEHNRQRVDDTRDSLNREHELRYEPYQIGGLLDAPPAREGMTQRWLAYKIEGIRSTKFNLHLRDGWVPRDPNTVESLIGYECMEYHDGSQVISIGECMVLCEVATFRAKEIASAWEKRALGDARSNRNFGVNQFVFNSEHVGVVEKDHDLESFSSEHRTVVKANIATAIAGAG